MRMRMAASTAGEGASRGSLVRRRELRVLGQEAVARVDRVCARLAGGADVLARLEVAPDLDGLVGGAGMQRAAVVRSHDGDGRDPELPAGAEYAQRDLAAIR